MHIIFSGLILVMLLGTIDQAIVAPALVPIAAEFGGFGNVSWVVTAYLLTSIASTPLAGRLSDIHGRRSVVVAALGLFPGTLLCGLAVNLDMLICGRAIQGLGGGALMALPNTIVADILSPRERALPALHLGHLCRLQPGRCWAGCCRNTIRRWIFWFKLPLILLAIVLSWFTLADLSARRRQHRIDYPGALLMVGATVFLLLALAWGGRQHAWDSPVILGLFSASVVLAPCSWPAETRERAAAADFHPAQPDHRRHLDRRHSHHDGEHGLEHLSAALLAVVPRQDGGPAGVLTAPLFGVVLGRTCRGNTCVSPAGTSCRRWWAGRGDGRVPGACGGGGHACPGCRRWPFLPAGRGHRREPAAHDGGIAELGAGGRYRHRHRRAHLFRAVGGAIGVAVFSAVVLHMLGPLGSQLETAHAAQGTVAGDAAAQEAVHAFSVFFGACALTLALAWRR